MTASLLPRGLGLAWLWLSAPALAQAPAKAPPAVLAGPATDTALPEAEPVTSYRLANGLEVVLLRDPRLPRVAVSVGYRVGARDDPPGYRGLAHLVEHMMFEGLRDAEHSGVFDYLADGGATDANATTDLDRTIYFEEVPRERLDLALWLESSRMGFLLDRIDADDLERARAAVLNEWDARVGTGGVRSMFALAAEAAYPPGHPYRRVNDEPDDIEAIQLADVQWFFQTYYGPANARLVLVGDFDTDTARIQIEHLFGRIRQRGPAPSPQAATSRADLTDYRIDAVWPYENQLCARVWVIAEPSPRERAALDVLTQHLVALLRDRLVGASGTATGLFGFHDEHELGSELSLFASLEPKTDRAQVLSMIDTAVQRVSKHGLSASALSRASQKLARNAIFTGEGLVSRAYRLASPRMIPRADPYVEQASLVSAVTSDAVRDAAARYLTPAGRVQVCMAQREGAPAVGKVISSRSSHGAKP